MNYEKNRCLVEFDECGRIANIVVPDGDWDRNEAHGMVYFTRKVSTLLQATEILRSIPSIPAMTFYVVETPDGNLGRDIFGFYTEAPLKHSGIYLETDTNKTTPVETLSLTAFGDNVGNQGTVAFVKFTGEYAKLVLLMECGHCGYKSPVETEAGELERQCYACGTVNIIRRDNIAVVTPSDFVPI